MLENKKFNLVLSFVLACALWFYVVGQMNPTTRKTYRYIPVMLINEQTLNDNGLAVLKVSDTAMRVTVSAKRDVVSKLSKSDIVATVDLTDAAEGKNQLPIDIKIPENVEIDNQSLNEITVTVEERVTKTKDVKVTYEGKFPEGEEPATIKVDPETVQVSGAVSLVDKVSYVKAVVKSEYVSEDLGSATSPLTAVTSGGNEVKNINLSDTKCKVTSIIYKTKTVSLNVPVKDNSDDRYTRNTSYPDTVTVKGPSDVLDSLTEVSAEEIDITGVTENDKIKIILILPEGVQLAGKGKDILLTVKVSKTKKKASKAKEVKSFTFTGDDVEIRNDSDGNYNVHADSLEVQVTGTKEQLSSISSSDIRLYVNADGLTVDTASVTVKAECDEAYADIAVIPSTVQLTKE